MFTKLVRMAGLNKTELADLLGLDKGTLYNWKEAAPKYAIAYLETLIELNRYKP